MGAGKMLLAQVLTLTGARGKHLTKLSSPDILKAQKNSHSPQTKSSHNKPK